jgi:hypothetical protein
METVKQKTKLRPKELHKDKTHLNGSVFFSFFNFRGVRLSPLGTSANIPAVDNRRV